MLVKISSHLLALNLRFGLTNFFLRSDETKMRRKKIGSDNKLLSLKTSGCLLVDPTQTGH